MVTTSPACCGLPIGNLTSHYAAYNLRLGWYPGRKAVDKHCYFTIKFESSYASLSPERNWNSPVNRIPLLSL